MRPRPTERARPAAWLAALALAALVLAPAAAFGDAPAGPAPAAPQPEAPQQAAPSPSPAGPPAGAEPSREATVNEARQLFLRGAEYVKEARWGEALASFEQSSLLRPHAVTTYNVAACERAMGLYTQAQKTFREALSQNDASGRIELPQPLAQEIEGYLLQLRSQVLANATVTLVPANASVTVDGRPLEVAERTDPPVLVAGIRPPGPGDAPPSSVFKLQLDPGAHVFTLSRRGYADAVVNRTFRPGSTTELSLHLDRLPATLHVASYPAGGVVTVEGADVGVTPVDVSRPAGSYKVVVRKPGYVTYETEIVVQSGEEVNLSPNLPAEKIALTQRWWFWTGVGVVLVGAAGGTYLLARGQGTPERPPPDTGGLGWALQLK